MEPIEAIRRAYFVDPQNVRAIARDRHHGRRVVREALTGATPEPRRYRLSRPKPRPVLDPVIPLIEARLEADHCAPRKQRHTAKRIYDRTVWEYGFEGSERIVRPYVHAWKRAHAADACFLPQAYAPGAEAQCDWGEALVEVAGVSQAAHLFCLWLGYSLKLFVCAFPTARQECFQAGHLAAFSALGGVPQRLTYDNLGSAVTRTLTTRNRQEHEQPLVESLVGYARRNVLVPVPHVASWKPLNQLPRSMATSKWRDFACTTGQSRTHWARRMRSRAGMERRTVWPMTCSRWTAAPNRTDARLTPTRCWFCPSRRAGSCRQPAGPREVSLRVGLPSTTCRRRTRSSHLRG